jgi:hypothetical protein
MVQRESSDELSGWLAYGEAIGVTETLFPILPSAGILIEF